MRYRTNHGLLIEAETSLDTVRRLREASWSEQNLSDQAFICLLYTSPSPRDS